MANIEISTFTRNNDGNTYVVKDTNAIPKSGSNQISGSLIPATDNSIDIGSSTKNIKALYTKGITINGAQFLPSDYVPRSGGAVMTSAALGRNVNNSYFEVKAGVNKGALVGVNGKDHPTDPGNAYILAEDNSSNRIMIWHPNGTLTWNGTAVQLISDARLKQQIAEIDDKLLDAWEDVNPVQFKYNDAVEQKGKDKARLHTGYVVQQIDEACKSHGVDISEYGLFCHEEYPERTEEVEVEQEDGTTKKETKVIEEASEHYSLRYTETLVVECAYLRKKNKDLENSVLNLQTEIADLKSVIAELKTAVQEIARK